MSLRTSSKLIVVIFVVLSSTNSYRLSTFQNDEEFYQTEGENSNPVLFLTEELKLNGKLESANVDVNKKIQQLEEENSILKKKLTKKSENIAIKPKKVAEVRLEEVKDHQSQEPSILTWICTIAKHLIGSFLSWFNIRI